MSKFERALDFVTLICFIAIVALGVIGYAAGK